MQHWRTRALPRACRRRYTSGMEKRFSPKSAVPSLPPSFAGRRLCTTRDAAQRIGCQQSYVRRLASQGILWSWRLSSRMLLLDADDVEGYARAAADRRASGHAPGRPPGGFGAS